MKNNKPSQRRSVSELRYIFRVERGGVRCWDVCIRRKRSTRAHKLFSDSKWGGKAGALRAAIKFRDNFLNDADEQDYALWRRKHIKRRDNTSGLRGVGRYAVRAGGQKKAYVTYMWIAFWQDTAGKRRSRAFSIKRYGERRAKALAQQARETAMRELFPKAKEASE